MVTKWHINVKLWWKYNNMVWNTNDSVLYQYLSEKGKLIER
ncbi:MAG: hypothetical protein K0R09_3926 [Clostridiales bacterium]|jgi:hypothetical protein|nr:hypothetical protein [Clostridiales bacterium]